MLVAHCTQPPKIVKPPQQPPIRLSHIDNWDPIGNDHAVLTELMRKLGVHGAQIQDFYSVDNWNYGSLTLAHGLIFLFKFKEDDEPSQPIVTDECTNKNIYFAKQVIENGCATQAMISILLNCNHSDIIIGSELTKLREFSMGFEPKMRGFLLGNTNQIRIAHNSMVLQTQSECDAKENVKSHDPNSFIAFMPINGHIYELNGLKEVPIDHGALPPEQDWMDVVRPIIMKKINEFTEGNISYYLTTLASDKKAVIERERRIFNAASQSIIADINKISFELQCLQMTLQYEDEIYKRYKIEKMKRRIKYLPYLLKELKNLAKDKRFLPFYEMAKESLRRQNLLPAEYMDGYSIEELPGTSFVDEPTMENNSNSSLSKINDVDVDVLKKDE